MTATEKFSVFLSSYLKSNIWWHPEICTHPTDDYRVEMWKDVVWASNLSAPIFPSGCFFLMPPFTVVHRQLHVLYKKESVHAAMILFCFGQLKNYLLKLCIRI